MSRRVTQSNGFKLLNPSYVRKIKRLVVIDAELRLALSADALRRTRTREFEGQFAPTAKLETDPG